jgi:alpha-1,3/alpha-1,6-mannosyltransferase
MILSLNRFERKKNVKLALETLAYLKNIDPQVTQNITLVIAGGYDPRVTENVEHFEVISFKYRPTIFC